VSCRTVLYNCDCDTFDDVERELLKVTGCSLGRARELSWEIHSNGSGVVYEGTVENCRLVAAALDDAGLVAKVSQ